MKKISSVHLPVYANKDYKVDMTHWYTRTMGNKFVQMSIGLIIKCNIKLKFTL